MAKRIRYKNHCAPLEQISVNGKYYLDSDCGKKLQGSMLLDLGASGIVARGQLTASSALGGPGIDFLAVMVERLTAGEVFLSFDNNTTIPIKLEEGESFASQISPLSEPYMRVVGTPKSGTIKVNYLTGVIV